MLFHLPAVQIFQFFIKSAGILWSIHKSSGKPDWYHLNCDLDANRPLSPGLDLILVQVQRISFKLDL